MKKYNKKRLTLKKLDKIYQQAIEFEKKEDFTHQQLLQALYFIWDVMDRALINMYVVGKTGDNVKTHHLLEGDKVEVAVRKNEWDSGSRSIADTFAPPKEITGIVVEYEYNGVPIKLYVLDDKETLQQADTILYENEYFKIPNPYEKFKQECRWLY